jgi:DNA-binding MarR family transcriptional regulator
VAPTAAQPQPKTELDTAQRLRIVSGRLSRRLRATDGSTATGLTPARISALVNIDRNGPLRLSDLAEAEGLNPTMLSRMVADFVAAGLVERSCDADDRRSAWVAPTPAGHRLAERVRKQRTAAIEAALAGLSFTDRQQIERALPALEALAEQLRQDSR